MDIQMMKAVREIEGFGPLATIYSRIPTDQAREAFIKRYMDAMAKAPKDIPPISPDITDMSDMAFDMAQWQFFQELFDELVPDGTRDKGEAFFGNILTHDFAKDVCVA